MDEKKYPRCWKRASKLIRRLAGGRCEWCKAECNELSVHHIGAPRPTGNGWKKGNPCDKHDLRRENLVALCWTCHSEADAPIREKIQAQQAKRQIKREAHAALNIGTGLVPFQDTVPLFGERGGIQHARGAYHLPSRARAPVGEEIRSTVCSSGRGGHTA